MTCARPLTEDQLGRLKETLCRLHRLKKVELEVRVDPSLLGGLRLELQGVTYDKSVRGGLDAGPDAGRGESAVNARPEEIVSLLREEIEGYDNKTRRTEEAPSWRWATASPPSTAWTGRCTANWWSWTPASRAWS